MDALQKLDEENFRQKQGTARSGADGVEIYSKASSGVGNKAYAKIIPSTRKHKYHKEMPREVYIFFKNYDGEGLPSFTKFAKIHGLTTEELAAFRRYKRFDEAWRECLELRRDMIIDRALTRKFDGSFSKLLLSDEGEQAACDGLVEFTLKVVDGGKDEAQKMGYQKENDTPDDEQKNS